MPRVFPAEKLIFTLSSIHSSSGGKDLAVFFVIKNHKRAKVLSSRKGLHQRAFLSHSIVFYDAPIYGPILRIQTIRFAFQNCDAFDKMNLRWWRASCWGLTKRSPRCSSWTLSSRTKSPMRYAQKWDFPNALSEGIKGHLVSFLSFLLYQGL